MIAIHWMLEYAAVLCGYVFLLFIWPSIVFRNHLAGKSKAYWFCFCVTVQIVLANLVVLTFGLIHILHRWTIFAFFFGTLLAAVLRKIEFNAEKIEKLRHLVNGAYGVKWFLFQAVIFVRTHLKKQRLKIWGMVYPHLGEYLVLSVLAVFAMIYFSYGAFQDYSYGFGDAYVHHSWISGLMEGKIFSGGIYPEAMHCFIYCLYALFGIKVYSSLLFFGGIHVVILLVSVYCLLREVFHWRYTPFFVLVIFLTIDSLCVDAVYSMSRLQWPLPQEFGLFTPFLCALFLVRYLKNANHIVYKGKSSKLYWDENLFLFAMAFIASVVTHFYTTIMAFLLCICFALFFIRKAFYYKQLVPLAVAVLCGLAVAVFPMAGAFASGIPFEKSIGWALGVMNGADPEAPEPPPQIETPPAKDEGGSMAGAFMEGLSQVYEDNYQVVYGAERGKWVAALTAFALLLWLIVRFAMALLRRYSKLKAGQNYFYAYLPMILAAFLFMAAYAAPAGFPQLIAGARLCSVEQILNLAVIMMPVDMVFSALALCCRKRILQAASIIAVAGIYVAEMALGVYHGYLYMELSQYNSAVMVTNSITRTLPKDSYTIVSPTDQLYAVLGYGRHEGLLDFVEKSSNDIEYTLPTKYIFLYIEKRPIHYAQSHFFAGPCWLAAEKYPAFFPADNTSQCPEIRAARISGDAASAGLDYENPWHAYAKLENRTILESKAYEWCESFSALYPQELKAYYEDDDFVCYYFEQEPNALYNLAIK